MYNFDPYHVLLAIATNIHVTSRVTFMHLDAFNTLFLIDLWEWTLLSRYVYTCKEFFIVTEDLQCNRMTVTAQQKNNIHIGNVQNSKNNV